MNNQNLLPPIKSTERARELGRKGGLSKSPLKSLSAKIRWLREKKKLGDETATKLLELMESADLTDLDILMHILAIGSKAKTNDEMILAAKLKLEWRKLRHGSKAAANFIKGDNVVVDQRSVNILTADERRVMMERLVVQAQEYESNDKSSQENN